MVRSPGVSCLEGPRRVSPGEGFRSVSAAVGGTSGQQSSGVKCKDVPFAASAGHVLQHVGLETFTELFNPANTHPLLQFLGSQGEGLLCGDYSLVSPLTQASSVVLVRDMDTESGRDTKSEKLWPRGPLPLPLLTTPPPNPPLPAPLTFGQERVPCLSAFFPSIL